MHCRVKSCPEPSIKEGSLCPKHLEKVEETARKRIEWLNKYGLCHKCKLPAIAKGACSGHRLLRNFHRKALHCTKCEASLRVKGIPHCSAHKRAYRGHKRRPANICLFCDKTAEIERLCVKHWDDQLEAEARIGKTRTQCTQCGWLALPGQEVCFTHLEGLPNNRRKAPKVSPSYEVIARGITYNERKIPPDFLADYRQDMWVKILHSKVIEKFDATKSGDFRYIQTALHNATLNWLRTYRRKLRPEIPTDYPWESLEDHREVPHQETRACLNQATQKVREALDCEGVPPEEVSIEEDLYDLLDNGYTFLEATEKFKLGPPVYKRRVIKAVRNSLAPKVGM